MVKITKQGHTLLLPENLSMLVPHLNSTIMDYFEYFESKDDNVLDFNRNQVQIVKETGQEIKFTDLPSFYEKAEFYGKSLNLAQSDILIYVGAYCGLEAITLSKRVSKVYAIEADKQNYDNMVFNLKKHNVENVVPIHALISEINAHLIGDSSITVTSSYSQEPHKLQKTLENIIDQYKIPKVDAIILDVGGGWEYHILATNLEKESSVSEDWIPSAIFNHKPKILVETHSLHNKYPFPQFQNFMKSQNYSCKEVERFLSVFPTFVCKDVASREGPDPRVKCHLDFKDKFPEFKQDFKVLALAGLWEDGRYQIYACNNDDAYWQTHIDRFFRCYELFIEPLLVVDRVPVTQKFTFLLSDGNQYNPYSQSYIVEGKHIKYPCFAWAFEDKYHMDDLDNIILIPDYYLTGDTLPHRHIDRGIKLSEYWKYDDPVDWDSKQIKFFWRGAIQCLSSPFTLEEYRNRTYLNQRLKFLIKCRESPFSKLLDCCYSSGNSSQLKSPPELIPEIDSYKLFSEFTPRDEFWNSKFVFSVEGYSYSSPSIYQTLASNSCPIFIDTDDAWWYKHNFVENVHFILIKRDLSDFDEKIKWCLDNLDKCKEIASNAKSIIRRINPETAISSTKEVFRRVLLEGDWNFKRVYDFSDRKALLDYKLKQSEEEKQISCQTERIPISLGGWCGIADIIREDLKLNPIAYPFDYIRSTFKGIIHYIKTNFEGFLTTTGDPVPIPGNSDLVLYPGVHNAFYSHDPTDATTKQAFERRFNKFNELLSGDKEVIFFRAMTHLRNIGEIELIENFKEVLNKKYPDLKWKLILISHRATDEDINSMKLIKTDGSVYIWTAAIKYPVETNYCSQYRRIIQYTMDCLENNLTMEEGITIHQDSDTISRHDEDSFEEYNHWPKDSWLAELGLN